MLRQFLILSFYVFYCASLHAAEAPADKTKSSSTQQVGGLLFDVDEGVKIEQGPGGSVYLRSNREAMEEKFKSIEARFAQVDERLARLEEAVAKLDPETAKAGKKSDSNETAGDSGRVLIT